MRFKRAWFRGLLRRRIAVIFLLALQKAQSYIFMEYFILDSGLLWDSILEILIEKASKGVEVRIIYDDIGCFLTLPSNFAKQLEQHGIKCVAFNPFRPFLSTSQNNRNHREITSIDGKVAFTGGLNLADEYVNLYEKHGYWKDCAVKVEGKAAWSLTLMFLEMWELCSPMRTAPWMMKMCASMFICRYSIRQKTMYTLQRLI